MMSVLIKELNKITPCSNVARGGLMYSTPVGTIQNTHTHKHLWSIIENISGVAKHLQ